MAWSPFRVSNAAKRSKRRRIHAMRPVQQNRTGQPWDKPGHDQEEKTMKKWNMVIDVAECTNCKLCTLAAMDEYVGNEWPGYAKPMPKHGHRWIDILQKERGQVPMIDVAYLPTMCNH